MSNVKTAKRKTIRRVILAIIAVVVLASAVGIGVCLFNERPAVQALATYQSAYGDTTINVSDDGGVEILPLNGGIHKTGIIFYVGAQIKPDAYIPLLTRIAEQGYPCFIPNLTCNMAILEPSAAEEIIQAHPEIEVWYIAGHSLGGLIASDFAEDHQDEVKGLIMLAAYTNCDMSEISMPALSVYGDSDGVLNKKRYDERLPWNSSDFEEYVISGANHAQFGDYGKQPRDNDANITADDQQAQTADMILDWLNRHADGGNHG